MGSYATTVSPAAAEYITGLSTSLRHIDINANSNTDTEKMPKPRNWRFESLGGGDYLSVCRNLGAYNCVWLRCLVDMSFLRVVSFWVVLVGLMCYLAKVYESVLFPSGRPQGRSFLKS
jgi:hypothetical protein